MSREAIPHVDTAEIFQTSMACFLTASTKGGQPYFDSDAKRALVSDALRKAASRLDVDLRAWVVLPDHYHVLLGTVHPLSARGLVRRVHASTAIRLNRLDATPGRRVWRRYWLDFPHSEAALWTYLNYIHLNPLKHGHLPVPPDCWGIVGDHRRLMRRCIPDVHQQLAQYPASSYHDHLRAQGEAFLTDTWIRYPIPSQLENDNF